MTADKAMTKEEFINTWSMVFDPNYGWCEDDNRRVECISDLNTLLRQELIKFLKWNEPFIDQSIFEETYDDYLKSQQ
jgi:hypothetical protein